MACVDERRAQAVLGELLRFFHLNFSGRSDA
jgi:hypothetical protein